MKKVKLIILNFNRLEIFKQLLEWCWTLEQIEEVVVVDNNSNYPPLLDYYSTIKDKIKLIKMVTNGNHFAPKKYIDFVMGEDERFIMTDPDVIPIPECPIDVIELLNETLDTFVNLIKAGIGLRVDDIPDHYPMKKTLLGVWEKKSGPCDPKYGYYQTSVDTTFALYRNKHCFGPMSLASRSIYPYLLKHVDWYEDPENLTPEYRNYLKTCNRTSSNGIVMKQTLRWRKIAL